MHSCWTSSERVCSWLRGFQKIMESYMAQPLFVFVKCKKVGLIILVVEWLQELALLLLRSSCKPCSQFESLLFRLLFLSEVLARWCAHFPSVKVSVAAYRSVVNATANNIHRKERVLHTFPKALICVALLAQSFLSFISFTILTGMVGERCVCVCEKLVRLTGLSSRENFISRGYELVARVSRKKQKKEQKCTKKERKYVNFLRRTEERDRISCGTNIRYQWRFSGSGLEMAFTERNQLRCLILLVDDKKKQQILISRSALVLWNFGSLTATKLVFLQYALGKAVKDTKYES